MKRTACFLAVLSLLSGGAALTEPKAQESPIILRVDTLLDGRGHIVHNTRIVIEGSKIARIDPSAGPVTYDLRNFTVLPGWIDAHVHITYHFGPNGRAEDREETLPQATLAAASNAYVTLMSGFTTVQSLGAPADKDLREAIARGQIPGPRILTAMRPLVGRGEATGTPEQIREFIKQQAAAGADVIKIFASKSIREGGGQTLSPEQLEAACSEAKAHGLRAVVHAYHTAIRAAVLAGCSQIEHGTGASEDDLKLMAQKGVYFDPQAGLVIQNYLDNKAKFLGIGNYTEEGFQAMEKAKPLNSDLFRRAIATPGLKVVFGTDAVAGAHGRNVEEFYYRVRECGQPPMDAMVSANSLAAKSLGLGDKIGAIAPGYEADIIALAGSPLQDITNVRQVVLVMKGGVVYKNTAAAAIPRYAGVNP